MADPKLLLAKRAALALSAAAALSGCGRGFTQDVTTEAHRRRAELHVSAEPAVLRQLDEVEARLLVGQARVRFWEELRTRHESVSAIACASQERHGQSIALFADRQRSQKDALASKNRVASRFDATSSKLVQ